MSLQKTISNFPSGIFPGRHIKYVFYEEDDDTLRCRYGTIIYVIPQFDSYKILCHFPKNSKYVNFVCFEVNHNGAYVSDEPKNRLEYLSDFDYHMGPKALTNIRYNNYSQANTVDNFLNQFIFPSTHFISSEIEYNIKSFNNKGLTIVSVEPACEYTYHSLKREPSSEPIKDEDIKVTEPISISGSFRTKKYVINDNCFLIKIIPIIDEDLIAYINYIDKMQNSYVDILIRINDKGVNTTLGIIKLPYTSKLNELRTQIKKVFDIRTIYYFTICNYGNIIVVPNSQENEYRVCDCVINQTINLTTKNPGENKIDHRSCIERYHQEELLPKYYDSTKSNGNYYKHISSGKIYYLSIKDGRFRFDSIDSKYIFKDKEDNTYYGPKGEKYMDEYVPRFTQPYESSWGNYEVKISSQYDDFKRPDELDISSNYESTKRYAIGDIIDVEVEYFISKSSNKKSKKNKKMIVVEIVQQSSITESNIVPILSDYYGVVKTTKKGKVDSIYEVSIGDCSYRGSEALFIKRGWTIIKSDSRHRNIIDEIIGIDNPRMFKYYFKNVPCHDRYYDSKYLELEKKVAFCNINHVKREHICFGKIQVPDMCNPTKMVTRLCATPYMRGSSIINKCMNCDPNYQEPKTGCPVEGCCGPHALNSYGDPSEYKSIKKCSIHIINVPSGNQTKVSYN